VKPEELVESLLWPKLKVKEGYGAFAIATNDGKLRQGYKVRDSGDRLEFRDPTSGDLFKVARSEIDELRETGTLTGKGALSGSRMSATV
jgi:hypothetical protein